MTSNIKHISLCAVFLVWVFMCTGTYECAYQFACIYVHMDSQRHIKSHSPEAPLLLILHFLPSSPSSSFSDRICHWPETFKLGFLAFWLSVQHALGVCLPFQHWDYKHILSHLIYLCGFMELDNSGPCAHGVSLLCTEPSLHFPKHAFWYHTCTFIMYAR